MFRVVNIVGMLDLAQDAFGFVVGELQISVVVFARLGTCQKSDVLFGYQAAVRQQSERPLAKFDADLAELFVVVNAAFDTFQSRLQFDDILWRIAASRIGKNFTQVDRSFRIT